MKYILLNKDPECPVTFVAGRFNLVLTYDRDNRVTELKYDGGEHKVIIPMTSWGAWQAE